ncbi:alcohol dehydrogenase catalytic domain-containing protein [Chitinophaga sp. MM2321]|uniref:zinc-dependent alcohol dehydrogenase n=1 Tax=Chitinophaga sp. MM2321 TaxID=3137178 RepID=UPI0032D5738A
MTNLPAFMQALQMRGLNQLVKTVVSVPSPKADEVLIRTTATTICTSDLHDLARNPFGIALPRVLGHEGAGVIVQCGRDVNHLLPGTRVAAHPVVPCGTCVECSRGYRHLCAEMGHLGYDRDGTFAEYFVQRADRVIALPGNIPASLGALLEPVAVCLQAVARAGDIRGRTVLVAGDGPFGNIIARLAKRAGADRVFVTGREPFRMQMIPGVEIPASDPVRTVDVAILAVSAPDALQTCLAALRPRGRLVVFSAIKDPVPLDLFSLHIRELEIVGACNDEERMEESLQCLGDPALNLAEIITHHIPFENWEDAFSLARDGHNKALKVAITF